MAVQPMSSYGVKNCLVFAFNCLRKMDRLVGDSLQSPYEVFHENLAKGLSKGKKIEYSIPNSEVEAFYLKRSSEIDFIASVQSRILSKVCSSGANSGGPGNTTPTGTGGTTTFASVLNLYGPLFSQVWDVIYETYSDICSKLPSPSGMHLWEIFLKLDTECELKVHVDDIVEVVVRIFKDNGHNESEEAIKEWFHGETAISFRAFFSPLVENYVGLLKVQTLTDVNHNIVNEFFKEGKLEKKGHVVHNWKMRWFVLTGMSLTYYETQEKAVAKGSLVINSNAVVQNMPEYRARPHRFRVICGETKTVTEISATDSQTMQEWVYTIRMAIKLHQTPGRNFLHKWKQVSGSKTTKKGVTHSTSVDTMLGQPPSHPPPVHRSLVATQSVPDTRKQLSPEIDRGQRSVTPTSPVSPTSSEDGRLGSYTDAPPLPPQRFGSPDIKDINSTQVFDKAALVEKRIRNQRIADTRRHSSLEPDEIEHIIVHGEDYAVIRKSPKMKNKRSNKDISALISPNVNAQLLVDATSQVEQWSTGEGAGRTTAHAAAKKSNRMDKTTTASPSKDPAARSPKKKTSTERQVSNQGNSDIQHDGLDYALVDTTAKKKKSLDSVPTSKTPPSPSAARKKVDGKPRSPRKNPERKNENSGSSNITDNGIEYATVDTSAKKKKKSAETLPTPTSTNNQLSPVPAGKHQGLRVRSESPEHRGNLNSEKEKSGERREPNIEYSTVVFSNSTNPPAEGSEAKKVKDFDKTAFDYSTVVFQNISQLDSVAAELKKEGNKKKSIPSQDQSSKNLSSQVGKQKKKTIYDSDEEVAEESPYVNVRRDGRQMNPPVVPPRRGAAAITEDSNTSDEQ